MRSILYILSILLFIGCMSCDVSMPGDSGDNSGKHPVQPIKRRPITPGDRIGRPRIIYDLDYSYPIHPLSTRGSVELTIRSLQTDEVVVMSVEHWDEYVEIEPMADTYEYLLTFEGEDVFYQEIIFVEE